MMRTFFSTLSRIAGATILAASSLVNAASFGAPVLESGLGEALRIVLPVVPGGRERLAVECVKLRPGGELHDISDNVRADVVTSGERQSVVLTTVRPVNDLVISVGVSLECGAFFLRRYTFLLDLPATERRGTVAPMAPPAVQAPVVTPDMASVSAAAVVAKAAAGSAGGTRPAKSAAAPGQRLGAAQSIAGKAASKAGASGRSPLSKPVRPEDEPGVLSRTRPASLAARTPRAPLAPPLRSMLKIELGGIDEFLASQPRLLLEQSTGMRLATDISAPDRLSAAALAGDRGFKQAHARYVAAMRGAPDPVATENEALGKRLDAFSKDLSSLRLDLQSTRARADALEASRVPWWWLVISAALAALAASAGATWWFRRNQRRPSGPLIDVDGARWRTSGPAPGDTPPESAYKRDFTDTVVMTRAERARRIARGEPDPAANASASAEVVAETAPVATIDPPDPSRDNSDDLLSFNLPTFEQPSSPPAAVEMAIAAASTTIAAAVAMRAPAAAPAAAATPVASLKVDKNSLTQQLATMNDLSDEAWASYRHSSDTSGVAVPFGALGTPGTPAAHGSGSANNTPVGTGSQEGMAKPFPAAAPVQAAAPVLSMDDLQIDFELDFESKSEQSSGIELVPVTQVGGAGVISTSDISALLEPPALDDAQSASGTGVTSPLPLAVAPAKDDAAVAKDAGAFALELIDLPAQRKAPAAGGAVTLTAIEQSAPNSAESERMRDVMVAASKVMETVHKLKQEGHPGGALRTLGIYLDSAPAEAPPGPWIQLAHTLHEIGMRHEYAEAQELFKNRFGVDLPGWEAAYEFKRHQMGLARVTGVEIMVAAGRGTPELIGRLAGLAYRVTVPPEVLFDLLLHRELLQQVVHTLVDPQHATGHGGDQVDISL